MSVIAEILEAETEQVKMGRKPTMCILSKWRWRILQEELERFPWMMTDLALPMKFYPYGRMQLWGLEIHPSQHMSGQSPACV